jgi:DNA-binding transcriptional ArsR family regulator
MKHERTTTDPVSTCKAGDGGHARRKAPKVSDRSLERAAGLYRAMGDAPRLKLLALLTQGECCVTQIVEALGEKNVSTVSQRLRVLRNEGLVARRREGSHVYYALADRHVLDLIHNALAHADELETGPKHGHKPNEGEN